MVLSESEPSTPPDNFLTVNTNFFNHEDLDIFLDSLEQTGRSSSKKLNSRRVNRSSSIRAQKTSEELFECSTLDDDQYLEAMENQSSYVPKINFSKSIEDIMKYFGEDVTLDIDDVEEHEINSEISDNSKGFRKEIKDNIKEHNSKTQFSCKMKNCNSVRNGLSSTVRETMEKFKTLTVNNPEKFTNVNENKEIFQKDNVRELDYHVKLNAQNYLKNSNSINTENCAKVYEQNKEKSGKSNTEYFQTELNSINKSEQLLDFNYLESSKVKINNNNVSNAEEGFESVNNYTNRKETIPEEMEFGQNYKRDSNHNQSLITYSRRFNNENKTEYLKDKTKYISHDKVLNANERCINSNRSESLITNLRTFRFSGEMKNAHFGDQPKYSSYDEIVNVNENLLKSEDDLTYKKFKTVVSDVANTSTANVQKIAAIFAEKISQSPRLPKPNLKLGKTSSPAKPTPKRRTIFLTECEKVESPSKKLTDPISIVENGYAMSSIREKIEKFNKLLEKENTIYRMDRSYQKCSISMTVKEPKRPALGVVVCERQKSVKYLAQQFEHMSISKVTGQICKSSDFKKSIDTDEQKTVSHTSSLTVLLKTEMYSSKEELERKNTQSTSSVALAKRSNAEISPSVVTEFFKPPKKIRRTMANPGIFSKKPNLERLFYEWFRTRGYSLMMYQNQNEKNQGEDQILEGVCMEQSKNTSGNLQKQDSGISVSSGNQENNNFRSTEHQTQIDEMKGSTREEDSGISMSIAKNINPTQGYYSSDENYSNSSTIPKVTTDESQPDSLDSYYERAYEVVKVRTPRRKRRIMLSNEDLTTDSDGEDASKNVVNQNSTGDSTYEKPTGDSACEKPTGDSTCEKSAHKEDLFDFDNGVRRYVISPNTLKSAYTLTIITSPSADSDFCDTESVRISLRELSQSCPSLIQGIVEERNTLNSDQSKENLKRWCPSNEMDDDENASSNNKKPILLPPRRSSYYETGGRWNTLQMQVIQEESDEKQSSTSRKTPESTDCGVCLSSMNSSPAYKNGKISDICNPRYSSFWITSGEFSVSTEIYYNPPERLHTLYHLFSQKCYESHNDMHFGIDHLEYSKFEDIVKEKMVRRLPQTLGCSQYWVLTGDFAITFKGKYLCEEKIKWFFNFIRDSAASDIVHFGVDDIEFSILPHLNHETNYNIIFDLNNEQTTKTREITYNTKEGSNSYSPIYYGDMTSPGNDDLSMPHFRSSI